MDLKIKLRDCMLRVGLLNKLYAKHRIYKVREFLMSPEEIRIAETDDQKKQNITQEYISRWPDRAYLFNCAFSEIVKRATSIEKENDLQNCVEEMRFCYFAYGFSPNEFICYGLGNKDAIERRTFVSERDIVEYGYRMNDILASRVFMDKMLTYQKFKDYYKRDAISVCGQSDYLKYLDFAKTHPIFVKKNVMESCGRSVELVKLSLDEESLNAFFGSLMDGQRYILEEQVRQSSVMSSLNPSSVNTVRCLTINTRHGVQIPWCFLKIGRDGSFIDNGGAGGILVGIDIETGILSSDGIDELAQQYVSHPDTGVVLKGFHLPDWKEMMSLCRELSLLEPKTKWIGWDMAHTDTGWVIIEGNSLSEAIGPQATFQSGIRQELECYMKDMNLIL